MVASWRSGLEEDTGKYSLLKAQFLFLLLWLLLPLASEIPKELLMLSPLAVLGPFHFSLTLLCSSPSSAQAGFSVSPFSHGYRQAASILNNLAPRIVFYPHSPEWLALVQLHMAGFEPGAQVYLLACVTCSLPPQASRRSS